MSTKPKTKSSAKTTALALALSTLFMLGCSSKQEIKIAPSTAFQLQPDELIFEPVIDANRTASTEAQASLMVWDLYAYIKELTHALKDSGELAKHIVEASSRSEPHIIKRAVFVRKIRKVSRKSYERMRLKGKKVYLAGYSSTGRAQLSVYYAHFVEHETKKCEQGHLCDQLSSEQVAI